MKPKAHWAASRHHTGLVHGFRSGLEEKNAQHLEAMGEPVLFEVFKLKYVIPQSAHTYTVDFRLGNGILIETKGLFESVDRAKHLYVRQQYPDLDLRLVFTRSAAPLRKGAKMTYAAWCLKHGIQYADKLIPEAWVREAGPSPTPEEVIKTGPVGYREFLLRERA